MTIDDRLVTNFWEKNQTPLLSVYGKQLSKNAQIVYKFQSCNCTLLCANTRMHMHTAIESTSQQFIQLTIA